MLSPQIFPVGRGFVTYSVSHRQYNGRLLQAKLTQLQDEGETNFSFLVSGNKTEQEVSLECWRQITNPAQTGDMATAVLGWQQQCWDGNAGGGETCEERDTIAAQVRLRSQ